MIVRDTPRLLDLLFSIRGSVLPKVAPRLLGLLAFSIVIVALDADFLTLPHTSAAPLAAFGVALSLFLGFRNNAAFERWWEGRRLWGQLVSDMRSLARETDLFIKDKDLRLSILRTATAFIHLHRVQLRALPDDQKARDWCHKDYSSQPHPPCAALNDLNALLIEASEKGALDGFGQKALSERIANIGAAQAGCERIAATPLPYVYSLLIFRTTYLYCLLTPLALIDSAGWMTPVYVCIMAYVFFGLAEVTEELAHPFGETVNGLPLDALCRTIEISMAPHIGVTPPTPLRPTNYYLS